MTVEERTQKVIDELFWGIGANPSKETIGTYINEALRDQIEDCAKQADTVAVFLRDNELSGVGDVEYVALRVRALAVPEEEEVKSNDR